MQVEFKNYEGGIVFYIDGTGSHGLVCSPTDQSTGIIWNTSTINSAFFNKTLTTIGSGLANTNAIVSIEGTGSNYAARICYDLVLNNFSDWYLPSLDELNLIYINLKKNGLGNLSSGNYWSSSNGNYTNYYNTVACYIDFSTGNSGIKGGYTWAFNVRAVRSF